MPTWSLLLTEDDPVETRRHWITRDDCTSKPYQYPLPAANRCCATVPSSYKEPHSSNSRQPGLPTFIPNDVMFSDDEDAELPSFLSPMQYDGLSQVCARQDMQQSACSQSYPLDAQNTANRNLPSKPSMAVSPLANHGAAVSPLANHGAAKAHLDLTDEIEFMEHADGTLSPQWETINLED